MAVDLEVAVEAGLEPGAAVDLEVAAEAEAGQELEAALRLWAPRGRRQENG